MEQEQDVQTANAGALLFALRLGTAILAGYDWVVWPAAATAL